MSDHDFLNYNVVTDGFENDTESLSVSVVKPEQEPVDPDPAGDSEQGPVKPAPKKRARKE